MQKFKIIQWGKNRSIVKLFDTEKSETTLLLINNNYLMALDEMGVIL